MYKLNMKNKEIEMQPTLENELVTAQPLNEDDFERLFKVASDPMIWEQHPNRERYKKDVFKTFFEGAIESKGAFLVFDKSTKKAIGSSRYYDFDKEKSSVTIGYTFLAKDHWGTKYNHALKTIMLNHAFEYVETVYFHVGAENIRSQKAMLKLGAVKHGEIEMRYHGEEIKLNFIYKIDKEMWKEINTLFKSIQ